MRHSPKLKRKTPKPTRMKLPAKRKGQCYFNNCKEKAIYGFISKDKNIQTEKYCKPHAYKIKNYKAFPNCKLIKLPKKLTQLPNILDSIDIVSKDKQREVMKGLLK